MVDVSVDADVSIGVRACIDVVAGASKGEGGDQGISVGACDLRRTSPVESSTLRKFWSHCSQQGIANIPYLMEADES